MTLQRPPVRTPPVTPPRRRRRTRLALLGVLLLTLAAVVLTLYPGTSQREGLRERLATADIRTSWIGNSFGGGDPARSESKWVQQDVTAIAVAVDGTVFATSTWDEGTREVGVYRDGDVVGKLEDTHGWGRGGGEAIALDERYVYVGMTQSSDEATEGTSGYPPEGVTWNVVRRYDRMTFEPSPFPGGSGYDSSMLVVSDSRPVTGLAVRDDELFVASGERVDVFGLDALGGGPSRGWSATGVRSLTSAPEGVWAVVGPADAGRVVLLDGQDGRELEQLPPVDRPRALSLDGEGRLLVADDGPRQQVLRFLVSPEPTLLDAVGVPGGVYAEPRGRVGPLRFHAPVGVGVDGEGALYVASGAAGTDLRRLREERRGWVEDWQMLGLHFVDAAEVDPRSLPSPVVFTAEERFELDLSQPVGRQWRWSSYTIDRFRHPDDPRLHREADALTASIRYLDGERFLVTSGMYQRTLALYRWEGEIAVPALVFSRDTISGSWPPHEPEEPGWIWRDDDADGQFDADEYSPAPSVAGWTWGWDIDADGDLRVVQGGDQILHYRFEGLDAAGVPRYAHEPVGTPVPDPLTSVQRLEYDADRDAMYLGGFTRERPNEADSWGLVGTELVRVDEWSTSPRLSWRAPLPFDPGAEDGVGSKAFDVEGDGVFVVDSFTAEVRIHDAETGGSLAVLEPGPEVGRYSGLVDVPDAIRARERSDGSYLILVEEDALAKVLMYEVQVTGME